MNKSINGGVIMSIKNYIKAFVMAFVLVNWEKIAEWVSEVVIKSLYISHPFEAKVSFTCMGIVFLYFLIEDAHKEYEKAMEKLEV